MPIELDDYYAGGAFVPSGTTGDQGPIPTSGQIEIDDFYGASSAASSDPVSITYNGQYNTENNQTSYTWTGAATGTAQHDRIVVVGIASTGNNANVKLKYVTINGQRAHCEIYARSTETDNRTQVALYSMKVPTGTTTNIVAYLTGSQDRFGMLCWSVYNTSGKFEGAIDTVDSSGQLHVDVGYNANGAVLGMAVNQESGGTWAWTGLTEDVDQGIGGGASTMGGAHAEYTSSGNVSVYAQCGDTTPLRQALVAMSFNPK